MTGGTGEHPLVEVLIAALVDNGALRQSDLEHMQRRLEEAEHDDAADALRGIRLSRLIDTPKNRRASIHSIDGGKDSDGGNGEA